MDKMKQKILSDIHVDGLCWGESKLEEIAYGLKKLIIGGVVKDRVSV